MMIGEKIMLLSRIKPQIIVCNPMRAWMECMIDSFSQSKETLYNFCVWYYKHAYVEADA